MSVRARLSPVVFALGFTSLLTDVSTEMVTSALPLYLVLHLRISPLQFGLVDAMYTGLGLALVSLVAGRIADRQLHKETAASGYGLSGISKLLLLVAGANWGWIAAAVALDRLGKGIRTAPRDALISLSTSESVLASAFAVHRALDSAGALLGPILAFLLLAWLPGAFDVLWVASAVFAALGIAVLWLFVPRTRAGSGPVATPASLRRALHELRSVRFRALLGCGLLLSAATVSDAFIYLSLQEKSSTPPAFFPLFYVITAGCYMGFAVPVGRLADRIGRPQMLLGGYLVLGVVYALLSSISQAGLTTQITCLALLGLYYAATEGVLMAAASAVTPRSVRTSGLALLATAIGIGKMASSITFGWLWSEYGRDRAISVFIVSLAVTLAIAAVWIRSTWSRPVDA